MHLKAAEVLYRFVQFISNCYTITIHLTGEEFTRATSFIECFAISFKYSKYLEGIRDF